MVGDSEFQNSGDRAVNNLDSEAFCDRMESLNSGFTLSVMYRCIDSCSTACARVVELYWEFVNLNDDQKQNPGLFMCKFVPVV